MLLFPRRRNREIKGISELKTLASDNEMYGRWGGYLVIFGLVVEVVVAWCLPSGKSPAERWTPIVANILIAVGVYVEIHFGRKALEASGLLQGMFEDRAAQAEFETEELRKASAWRALSTEQHTALAKALKSSGPSASVLFWVVMNDPESLSFAYKISHPFRIAGWKVGFNFNTYAHDIITEILLPEPNVSWLQTDESLAKRVWKAFSDADIAFTNGWTRSPNLTTSDSAYLTTPIAHVYVGPKPAPMQYISDATPART